MGNFSSNCCMRSRADNGQVWEVNCRLTDLGRLLCFENFVRFMSNHVQIWRYRRPSLPKAKEQKATHVYEKV